MRPLTSVQSYFEDLARMDDLKLIDEHEFIERVYADMPPVWHKTKERQNPMKTFFKSLLRRLAP